MACLPCESSGEKNPASMYCFVCVEPLCKTCADFHKKFRATKTHKLVQCSKEDSGFLDAQRLSPFLFCQYHTDEPVKIKCEVHNTICCVMCALIYHRNCHTVSEIDKIAKGYRSGGQTKTIRTRLEGTKSCIEEIINVNEDCRKDFEKSKEDIPKQLEQIKTKFFELYIRIEFFLMKRLTVLQDDEDISIGSREEAWKLKLNAHDSLLKMLDSLIEIGTDSQVYVAVHKIKEMLVETEKAFTNQGSCIIGQRLNLKLKEKLETLFETDTVETLVDIESVQNQFQLPKTAAHCISGAEYETKLSSDSLPDNERNYSKSDETSHTSVDAKKENDLPSENIIKMATADEKKKQLTEIRNAINKISIGEDLQEEMEISVGLNASWEVFLEPTPLAICLLGDLMIISAISDFSLDQNPPKDGFKFIRYPQSFRDCLVQVTNASWDAFNAAHTNMDKIRLFSSNVSNHLKDAVSILLKDENHQLEEMLPIPLHAIHETVGDCLALATSVENKFIAVMSLTTELLEDGVVAKGFYEQKYKEAEIALEVATENKRRAEKQIELAKNAGEQWGKIACFFQMMSNLIGSNLNSCLTDFLEFAKVSKKKSLEGFRITALRKDMIYMQAFHAAKIAYSVNMIAGGYVEISNAHLMDRIAGLGKLLGYDPEKEVRELLIERKKLQNGLQQAQVSIREIVKKRKTEIGTKFATLVRKIKPELENALSPPSLSERRKKLKQTVMEKIKVAEQDEPEKGLDVDDFI